MTGFSPKTRRLIYERACGLCESCTRPGAEIHHRRPRGAGGSKDPLTNTAANGVLLCSGCHRWIESHRADALDEGWLVRQSQDPRTVPLLYRGSKWACLTLDGGIDYGDELSDYPA